MRRLRSLTDCSFVTGCAGKFGVRYLFGRKGTWSFVHTDELKKLVCCFEVLVGLLSRVILYAEMISYDIILYGMICYNITWLNTTIWYRTNVHWIVFDCVSACFSLNWLELHLTPKMSSSSSSDDSTSKDPSQTCRNLPLHQKLLPFATSDVDSQIFCVWSSPLTCVMKYDSMWFFQLHSVCQFRTFIGEKEEGRQRWKRKEVKEGEMVQTVCKQSANLASFSCKLALFAFLLTKT